MSSIEDVRSQILEVEGFDVAFLRNGAPSAGAQVPDYPYQRAAKGAWTVAVWRARRFDEAYRDWEASVLDPSGEVVHGRTLLTNLRASYLEVSVEEPQTDGGDEVVPDAPSIARVPRNATRDLESTLWEAADKMRGNLEAAEYKHVVLGLVFLKYVTDAFESRHEWLVQATADPNNRDYYVDVPRARESIIESRDEYTSESVFWVPVEARWKYLQDRAKLPEIGVLIDQAMDQIEKENPSLRGVLPKTYARIEVDKRLLGELVDLIGKIGFTDADHGADDVLGRVYEYFLGKFASAEGKRGGEYYTPRCVVRLLVEMLEPFKGRVYDPCCGSGGMFVQSAAFVAAHGGRRTDLSVFGQEVVATTWRLGKMNLALRGIEANLSDGPADSFHHDRHPDLRADFILANPPFNVSDWGGERLVDDARWAYGVPPTGNANFAWVQHIVHHLAPSGSAGFVLAKGSMTSNQSGEGEIRRRILEADLVDCMISLPGQLFYTTPIPVCLWFLARNKKGPRDRRGELLFIDARRSGVMVGRVQRELLDTDIGAIAGTYHAWRGEQGAGTYEDVPGYCKSAQLDEVASRGYVLTPGRYVGSMDDDDEGDEDSFETTMKSLVSKVRELQSKSARLSESVDSILTELGYGR